LAGDRGEQERGDESDGSSERGPRHSASGSTLVG
jgi:hypothetical protein